MDALGVPLAAQPLLSARQKGVASCSTACTLDGLDQHSSNHHHLPCRSSSLLTVVLPLCRSTLLPSKVRACTVPTRDHTTSHAGSCTMQACRSELHATSRLARYSRPCTVQAGGGSAASGTWRRLSCAGARPGTSTLPGRSALSSCQSLAFPKLRTAPALFFVPGLLATSYATTHTPFAAASQRTSCSHHSA